jgi:predicted Zn-dependent protease with MMP-like domain
MDGSERGGGSATFEELIEKALDDLPDQFRAGLGTVAIVIDEQATPEMLARTGSAGLFGVYQGIPRTAWGADHAPVASKITIFRRPLEAFNPHPEALARAVRETLFHEIAHHFGISDARLDELSRESRRRRARPQKAR